MPRLALFASVAVLPLTASHAAVLDAGAQPERDYLPPEIVVTGAREGYGLADGASATKTKTRLIDVPQGVSFITADQLEDQSIRQLNEALRYIPGVSLETGEGHRDEVFIRGQETSADFYLDGLRDDAQYYRPLYNVERVEVLKGANALIFGRGAGGGAINRVSKTANTGTSILAGQASVDSFGAFALLGDVNQPLADGVAARLNGTYEEFDSHRDFYEGRFIGISPTLGAELGPDTRLNVTYSYDDDRRVTDRGVPALDGGPLTGFDETFFGDADFNQSRAKVHIARARMDHELAEGLDVNATVQYANYGKIYANILPTGTDGETVTLGGYEDTTDRENLIGQANLIWTAEAGSVKSTLLAGIEGTRQDTQNARRNVTFTDTNSAPLADRIDVPAFTLAPTSRSRDSELTTLSLYVQEQLFIGDHVELIAGLRWDRFDLETADLISGTPGDRTDERVSPRGGIIVKPIETLSVYASYAESFLPQAGDQFLILSPGDSGLEPEKFTNYELGLKWAPMNDMLVTAAVFRLDRTNTTAPDPDNSGLRVQTGESRVEGFEIGAAGKITDFWKANLGYAYLDGELRTESDFGAAGARLQQLPKHQITAWNRFDLNDTIGLGLGVIHQSSQFASFSNTVTLPSYWRVDAAAYYTVNDHVSVQLNIENLFDESYYPSAHGNNNIQPAEPFSARVGVRLEL